MPRRAPYLLRWSLSGQIYEIISDKIPDPYAIIPGSPAWYEWLEGIPSFAFHSRSGTHYTVRKETIQQSGAYWYGYRSLHGQTIKRYLGRTIDLSIARLEEIADQFTDTTPSGTAQPAPLSSTSPSAPLLVSRLHPPRLPLALVERSHLLARLDAWRSHKLTLLWAPAGFGKTTLVNSWLMRNQAHSTISDIAWVSLEASDNDPVHFWRSIIGACQNWREEVGKTALAYLLSALQPPFISIPIETILTFFLNDLARQISAGILILDDYHVITEPRLHEALIFFIEHLPTRLHVVILTRSEPPLPLARWRAQGDMQELHTTDLRFSSLETATFLQRTTAATFSEHTIAQLDTLLQGWAAGLRLLVLAGQATQAEVERHLSSLDGQQRPDSFRHQLLDYFVSEVLNAQPEPLQLFLLQTSILKRLTGPLCAAITGRQDSTALLETIERAGLFLEALDEVEPWYRYHALFAETMHVEAQRRLGEEELRTLSSRASRWYEQHALPVEAIETALYAHDAERAGMLIERFGAEGQRYELHTLRRWLQQIPDAILLTQPALCLYSAITLQFMQEQVPLPETREALINEMLSRAEDGWRRQGQLSWVGQVFAIRALGASLNELIPTPEVVTNATTALALLPEANSDGNELPAGMPEWRTICLGIVASAAMHQGRFGEAQQLLQEALALSLASGNRQFIGEIHLRLGAVCMARGELHQAGEYYRQALTSAREHEGREDQARALLGLARLSFEWNDLTVAEQQTREALELAQQGEQTGKDEATYLLTRLYVARGQEGPAQFQLAELIARLQAMATPGAQELLPDALALQVRLQLSAANYRAARRSLTLLENSAQELSFAQQIMVNILQARLQLAEEKTSDAMAMLERLLPTAQTKQHLCSELEMQLLLSRACAAKKQKDEARRWLQQALSRAHSEGFMRTFLSEGESLSSLLSSLLPAMREKTLRSYGQAILRAFMLPEEAHSPAIFINNQPNQPLEPLSTQERRVLRLLVAGHTNPEIASEMVISVNTVKDHVKHLYHKLGVNNRQEARKAARQLEHF